VAPLIALSLALPGLASGQATRTWVSGVGDDANPCSRTAPCKTFAGAISKTAVNGEINVIDDGGFGTVTVTKSITIDGGHHLAGLLSSGTNGITINSSGSPIRVILRNLSINGAGTGLSGVRILSNAAMVRIENTQIFGFTNAGVDMSVSDGTSRRLEIRHSQIHSNYGTDPAGVGLWVRPTAGGVTGKVTVSDSSIDDNGRGVVADATTGKAKVTIRNTTVEDNGSTSGTGQGIQAIGANGVVRLSDASITGNLIGLEALTGGSIVSFGNNVITANDFGGAPTSTIPLS
jgi:hypothetical protein